MRILVFQHHAAEHLGGFREHFRRDGILWDSIRLDAGQAIPDLGIYDAMFVLGGSLDVWEEDKYPWMKAEKSAIRTFVRDLSRPYFGICLGHQLLADALGGSVRQMKTIEIGMKQIRLTQSGNNDAIFAGLPHELPAFQWHECEVQRLPGNTVILAANDHCSVQAMRVGTHAYGVQFHVEIDEATLEDWSTVTEYEHYLEKTVGPTGPAQFERPVRAMMRQLSEIRAKLYAGFINVVRTPRR
jgi:GMP synthase-like glutamine amidotransferase